MIDSEVRDRAGGSRTFGRSRAAINALMDFRFRQFAIEGVLPAAYRWAIVAAVVPPVALCIVLFGNSWIAGVIGLLCLPFVVVASLALMRLFLEILRTMSTMGQSVGKGLGLLYGLDDTLREVSAPAGTLAKGLRAGKVPGARRRGR